MLPKWPDSTIPDSSGERVLSSDTVGYALAKEHESSSKCASKTAGGNLNGELMGVTNLASGIGKFQRYRSEGTPGVP